MREEHKEKYRRMGLKIGYYRKLKGHTQETFAEAIGLTKTFIGQVECGAAGISLDNIFAIAEVLDVPAWKFFKYEDD